MNESVIRKQVIDDLRQLAIDAQDPGFVAELIKTFFRSSDIAIDKMSNAHRERNGVYLMAAAHSFKSSSANLGAFKVNELCLQLERAGENEDFEKSEVLLKELLTAYAAARAELEKIV